MKRHSNKIFRVFAVLALMAGIVGSLVPVGRAHAVTAGFAFALSNTSVSANAEWTVGPFTTTTARPAGAGFIVTFPSGTTLPATIQKSHITWTTPAANTRTLGTSDPDPVVNQTTRTVTFVLPSGTAAPAGGGTVVGDLAAGANTLRFSQLAGIVNPAIPLSAAASIVRVGVTDGGEAAGDSAATLFTRLVTFTPSTTTQGGSVTITGRGFAPNTAATAGGGTVSGSGTVGADGVVTINAVRLGAAPATVSVTDGAGNVSASAAALGLLPHITITGSPANTQGTLTIEGRNFTANSNIAAAASITVAGVALAAANVTLQTPAFAAALVDRDNDGGGAGCPNAGCDDFRYIIRVPSGLASGARTITVTDAAGATASADITVNARSVSLSPASGPVGTLVSITGVGFPAGVAAGVITVALANAAAVTASPLAVSTDTSGAFTSTFVVPAMAGGTTFGSRTVTVTAAGPADGAANTAFGSFNITDVAASLTLSPNSGPRGTLLSITGSSFATSPVAAGGSLTIGGALFTGDAAIVVNADGSLTASTRTVPAGAAYGANTVLATDATPRTAVSSFNVTQPTISISPATGNVGSNVRVAGAGWLANSIVTITRQGAAAQTVTADASGSFTSSVPITAALVTPFVGAATAVIIGANDGATGNVAATSTFTINAAAITASAATGAAGSSVTVNGTGFLPTTGLTALTIGGISVLPTTPVISDSLGNWSVTFTVPGLLGVQTITATHSGIARNVPFTITAAAPATSVVATTALAPVINNNRMSIAWYQDVSTGVFQFLAPGVASTLANIPARSAIFLNLTAPTTLRVDGQQIVVPAGGRWIAVIDPSTIEFVS